MDPLSGARSSQPVSQASEPVVQPPNARNESVRQVPTGDAEAHRNIPSPLTSVGERGEIGGGTWTTIPGTDLVLEADFSNLEGLPDALEIIIDPKGPNNDDGSLNLEKGHLKPTGPGSWVAMGFRSLLRDDREQDANRAGMDAVANLRSESVV